MRTYNQYCSVAKALDVIGDRWNLLIVRELVLQERCRYTDLQRGLPGIATNLLAERLRELERLGVIAREEAPPPIATTLFSLTERGAELAPILQALGRWGAPLMVEPDAAGEFRSHWLAFPVELFLAAPADGSAVAIEVRTGERPIAIEAADGELGIRPLSGGEDGPEAAELLIEGPPQLVIGLLSGALSPAAATARGLRCEGDLQALERLRRREPAAALLSAT